LAPGPLLAEPEAFNRTLLAEPGIFKQRSDPNKFTEQPKVPFLQSKQFRGIGTKLAAKTGTSNVLEADVEGLRNACKFNYNGQIEPGRAFNLPGTPRPIDPGRFFKADLGYHNV
jgi:hypothetical protein